MANINKNIKREKKLNQCFVFSKKSRVILRKYYLRLKPRRVGKNHDQIKRWSICSINQFKLNK